MGKMPECFKKGIMGCFPSKRRSAEGSSTEEQSVSKIGGKEHSAEDAKKSGLPPTTIQLVNEDTLKLLRDIGELKVYKTASVNHKKNMKQHHDIMLALENPTKNEAPNVK